MKRQNSIKGIYRGPIKDLKGKSAILKDFPRHPKLWLAQFDDATAEHDGRRLGYGWHRFAKTDWKVV